MDVVEKQLILPDLDLSNLHFGSQQLDDHVQNICTNLIKESKRLSIIKKKKFGQGEKESIPWVDVEGGEVEEHGQEEEYINEIGIKKLNISHNNIGSLLPSMIVETFGSHLTSLDLSDNSIIALDCSIIKLTALVELNLSSNQLTHKSFPPDFAKVFSERLKVLVLKGNRLGMIPCQIYKLKRLESLHLGSNQIECLPKEISSLNQLKVLYLGGNKLRCVANQIGQLSKLEALALCDNQLQHLPPSISKLRNLRSLALHNNNLTTLPQDIIKLNRLIELSLRNNPLVVRFVQDIAKTRVLPLLELCARAIKTNNIQYSNQDHHNHQKPMKNNDVKAGPSHGQSHIVMSPSGGSGASDLPEVLLEYLNSACRCVNPKCKGVYFESKVEHVKFVDFCGSYRLPLLQFLCSQECTEYRTSDEEEDSEEGG